MFDQIYNQIKDKRPSKRTLIFGISFAAAAFILSKTNILSKLKQTFMGTKASCCSCNQTLLNQSSSEINFDNMPLKKNKKNNSSNEQGQNEEFVFVNQSSNSSKINHSVNNNVSSNEQSNTRSILKRNSAYNNSINSNNNEHIKKIGQNQIQSTSSQEKQKHNFDEANINKDQDKQYNEEKNNLLNDKQTNVNNEQNNYLIQQQLATQNIQEVPKIDETIKVQTRGTLNIIYGTTGGNSARLAANLIAEARQQKYQPKLVHLGDFDAVSFSTMDRAIFVVSTYGVGGPTGDAAVFYEWLSKQNDPQLLSHLKYLVFALGNSTFENFAGFGVKVDAKLEQLGASRIYPLGKGNAAEDTTDDDFNKWKVDLWDVLNKQFDLHEITLKEQLQNEAGFELNILPNNIEELDFDNYNFQEDKIESRLKEYFGSTNAPIKEIRELRQKPQESSCLHIDFDIASLPIAYKTAGNLGVYPENDPKSVEDFATLLGYNLDDIFDLKPTHDRQKLPLPTPMKVRTFLTKFCDIFGPVNKIILQGLAELSHNQELQETCDKWVQDNKSFEENIRKKNHSIFSLCKEFKIRIPLLNLIKLSNRMFPRFYTISSSNQEYPKNIHMCISISSVNDPSGQRKGQASSFFSSLKQQNNKNKKIRIFYQESLFTLPQDKSVPIIMVGPGAGLAPFRGFLQEKQFLEQNKQNDKLGDCSLYFGCRGKKVDYIYQNDLEAFQKNNTCNNLRLAFSREGPNKVYVQDLLQEDIDIIAEKFLKQNGIIYVCGSKNVGEAVKEFIINLYSEKEGLIPYLAYSKIQDLESEKRLIMEVWG